MQLRQLKARATLFLLFVLASCLNGGPLQFPAQLDAILQLSESGSQPAGKAAFAVVAAGPRGQVSLAQTPVVSLVFNRAMHDDAEGDNNAALARLSVATQDGSIVAGKFRWVGLHGALFQPERPFLGATTYKVNVPAGTPAADGSKLDAAYVLSFTTDSANLVASVPSAGSDLAELNEPIRLRFVPPVAAEELAAHLQVVAQQPGQQKPLTLAHQVTKDTSVAGPEAGSWLLVKATTALPLESEITLHVSAGLHSEAGPVATTRPIRWSMTTHGPLTLRDVECARVNLGRCQAHRDLSVKLTTPVSPSELRRHLKLIGPKRNVAAAKGQRSSDRPTQDHPLLLDPEYGDKLEVKLLAGMRDRFGQRLQHDVSVTVEIESPFLSAPQVSTALTTPQPGTDVGPAPDGPHRLSLPYNLEFGIRGNVVEAMAGNGLNPKPGTRRLQLGAVNLPTIGLRSQAFPQLSAVRWLGRRDGGLGEARPEPEWQWFTPNAPAGSRAIKEIDLNALLNPESQRGTLLLEAKAVGSDVPESAFLSVTDLGISTHAGRRGSVVWITQLSTGKPVPLATLTVYSKDGTVLSTRQTDGDGVAAFAEGELVPAPRRSLLDTSRILVAQSANDWTYQRLEPALNPTPNLNVDLLQENTWVGLVFADRGVYRPGEHLHAGGYFRRTAEHGLILKPGQEFEYTLSDPGGEVLAQGNGQLDGFGSFALDLTIPKGAAIGSGELAVRLDRESGSRYTTSLQILEYKPAEFKVGVTSSLKDMVHGASSVFTITGEYLYGAPMPGAHVDTYLTSAEVRFVPAGLEDFSTTDTAYLRDLNFTPKATGLLSHSNQLLDATGSLQSTTSTAGPSPLVPISLTLEAEVQDLGAQTQSSRASVLVHPAEFYLGLRPLAQRFVAVGASVNPELVALTPKGSPVATSVKLELLRRNFNATIEDRPANPLYESTHIQDEPRGECTILSGQKKSCALRVTDTGYYLLRASAQDSHGNVVHASTSFYSVGNQADSLGVAQAWRESDRRLVGLETDRESYREGELANVLIKNPFRHATALVSVERGSVLYRRVVELDGPAPTVQIPIQRDFFPNAYVSVHLLRGRISEAPVFDSVPRADIGGPQYRIGYTQLKVNPESRRIQLSVTPSQPTFQPGAEAKVNVRLADERGQPLAGSVTVYVVDEGTLALTGYQTPDPLAAFSGPRPLGTYPLDNRQHLAQFVYLKPGQRFAPYGWETPGQAADGDKGYEGGDGASAVRSNFRTTIFFEAGRSVGANGQTDFRFKLPDNLTTFRIMAVAAGDGDRFGSGQGKIAVQKPLMLRPQLPRMLRAGDRAEVGVVVSTLNPTAANAPTAKVSVSLATTDAKGKLVTQTQLAQLANVGQTRLQYSVVADQSGQLQFDFAAESAGKRDRVLLKRNVVLPTRKLSAATYGSTATSGNTAQRVSVGLGPLDAKQVTSGTLHLELASDALVGIEQVFSALEAYPYGCSEQLASRVLPFLTAPDLLTQAADAVATRKRASAETQRVWIDEALGQLMKHQSSNGSFGFWQDDPAGPLWLTAYALLALDAGHRAGYFVPRHTLEYALNALDWGFASRLRQLEAAREGAGASQLEAAEGTEPESESGESAAPFDGSLADDGKRQLALAEAAYVADVLSTVGGIRAPKLRRLLAFWTELPLPAKAQLIVALSRGGASNDEVRPLLNDVLKATRIGSSQARVESSNPALASMFDSPARTTAWVLRAVLAAQPENPVLEKLVRGLVSFRTQTSYRNPQESAWALLALGEYRKLRPAAAAETAFEAEVRFGEQVHPFVFNQGQARHLDVPIQELLNSNPRLLQIQSNGATPVFYSASLDAAVVGNSPRAIDAGLSVEKHMRAVTPEEVQHLPPLLTVQSEQGAHLEYAAALGQLVAVEVLLEATAARDQVVVEDPLPAGLEGMDIALTTTNQALNLSASDSQPIDAEIYVSPGLWQLHKPENVRREIHDDRVVLFVGHLEPGIHRLRYLARATTQGRFQMPATRASCMYEPEVFGQTAAAYFDVVAAAH